MSVNKVLLLGNLGRDPELRFTPSQVAVCTFSIATSERRKDQSGNWVDHTEWHNIVVFGNAAQNSAKYLKKGRQVFIEGRIQTRKWQDKEGRDRYTTEIIAERVQFVGTRADRGDDSYPTEATTDSFPTGASAESSGNSTFDSLKSADDLGSSGSSNTSSSSSGSGGDVTFDEDDIPF